MTDKPVVGLLHPGAMGHRVGACAVSSGHTVLWASAGRSAGTRARAESAGLTDAGSVAELLARSDIVLSICPPHAAEDLAAEVATHGYRGIYVDANAISPETARQIGAAVGAGGATAVDGGILGWPPTKPGMTRLFLSGAAAAPVAAVFGGTLLDAVDLGPSFGAASALKMCCSAYPKAVSALLVVILAMAEAENVKDELLAEWQRAQPHVANHQLHVAEVSLQKAWRFVGEMEEIADTLAGHGIPDGIHRTAADLFQRLAVFKDDKDANLDRALAELLQRAKQPA